MPGRILLISTGLLVPYAMVSLLMPIHIFTFIIINLFLWDIIIGFFLRQDLSIIRKLPYRIAENSIFKVEYKVKNNGSRTIWDIECDFLPLPRGVKLKDDRTPLIESLAPGEEQKAYFKMHISKRGEYIFPSASAGNAFPFGFWRWSNLNHQGKRILVHPSFTKLNTLNLPLSKSYQPEGVLIVGDIGESYDFKGCREYRPGDNPRNLHWGGWARTGEPVVKEFIEEYICRVAVMVDTYIKKSFFPTKKDKKFEAALSLTSAITDFVSDNDYSLDIFSAGSEVYHFKGGGKLNYHENILDILACQQPEYKKSLLTSLPAVLEEKNNLSSVVIILLELTEDNKKLIDLLHQNNLRTKIFIIDPPKKESLPSDNSIQIIQSNILRKGGYKEL